MASAGVAPPPSGLFARDLPLVRGVYLSGAQEESENERHTNEAFSEKWTSLDQQAPDEDEGWKQFQFRWYLSCYGYESEAAFARFLSTRRLILDAGCGPGYKAAWFARLNPEATVVAMDLSDAIHVAAERYGRLPNMVFVKGDIADTPFCDASFDFVSCDQVLHHTDDPPATVREFARVLGEGGALNTYVYARKSLPRELLDEHLREYCKKLSRDQIWEMSDQLTQLGKKLSELNLIVDFPDVPALGIRGGPQDLQRFIYWNFVKCFWNPEHGYEASKLINFDWYAPSNAYRYTIEEFEKMVTDAGFKTEFLHSEEACHTGRFRK
jgi:SAM-dependent methyltransferase